MLLLAFETSCDDTSIAIFRDRDLVVMKTRSQIREHNETKGVVPEVAARLHANNIFGVLEEVLSDAEVTLEQIDVIACTEFPGLMPSLLVGMSVAKTLAKTLQKPYISIDHIEAHMFANYIGRETDEIPFPSICLTVSGGHNELYLWKSMFEREKIGETLDDSAGEAFDKVAKMMGLGYPGGPIIGRLASEYEGKFHSIFPKVLLDKAGHDFSFSGLKSAVKREVDRRKVTRDQGSGTRGENRTILPGEKWKEITGELENLRTGELTEQDIREIAFEFEQTVVDILSYKLFHAAETYGVQSVVLAGGVSANDRLLQTIADGARERGYSFTAPIAKVYSQDNAAMVGILAYYKLKIPR